MVRRAIKRKIEVIDLTSSDKEYAHHQTKHSRSDASNPQLQVSRGQRFGQETAFVPLSQSSQVPEYYEDEDDAGQIIQNSQGFDDAAYNSSQFYGE
jgi:SWI/SNF-related matrix-associated actin-dependent regulator of chromatin subfamily A3